MAQGPTAVQINYKCNVLTEIDTLSRERRNDVFSSVTLPSVAHSPRISGRYVIVLVLLMMAVGIAFIIWSLDEPSYQGKRLTSWLRDLRNPSPLVQRNAQEAVSQLGTNAVPVLREMLHASDSPLRTNLVN